VEFEGGPPPARERYWRGPVFSRFDGRTWSPVPSGFADPNADGGGRALSYTVMLEPTQRRSLFALELPAALPTIESDSTSRAPLAPRLTRDQQVLLVAPAAQAIRYSQRSLLRSSHPAAPGDARANLGLGEGNPRTRELAREMREQLPDERAYVRAVLARFHDLPFVYSLSAPVLSERDPVDQFLFDTRRGFCEHYASAFVLMLRAAGIPARVVTGYQGGAMNTVRGNYMIVRQSDAHAWAEALIDGEWRRFDPTAAVAPSRIEIGLAGALPEGERMPFLARFDAAWLVDIRLAWDALNYSWRRNVVGFDRQRQRNAWHELRLDVMPGWQIVGLVGLFIAGWGALVVGWLMYKRRHQERALVLWDDLNRRLARAGLPREPHEGPLAFSGRAAARWPQFAIAFAAIGESFAELRYGATRAGRERDALVATLQRAIEVLPAAAALRTTQ
ncbi:MAG: DUF3488 domain-containing protein, partial [Burkholderiales bacterium]|nr:DUF3488 domain-containing protein [Burkholderiales bacterium]